MIDVQRQIYLLGMYSINKVGSLNVPKSLNTLHHARASKKGIRLAYIQYTNVNISGNDAFKWSVMIDRTLSQVNGARRVNVPYKTDKTLQSLDESVTTPKANW